MMLDAITAVGGIMFIYLAIRGARRRAWREIPRVRHAAFNAKQGAARQDLRPRRLIPFVALIAGIVAIGAAAYFELAQDRTIGGPVRVIDGDTIVVAGVHVRLNGSASWLSCRRSIWRSGPRRDAGDRRHRLAGEVQPQW
jgi:hypothetical protein